MIVDKKAILDKVLWAKLNSTEMKVFLFLLLCLNITDYKIERQTNREIADRTSLPRSNISKAFRSLQEKGIIDKLDRDYYFSKDLFID